MRIERVNENKIKVFVNREDSRAWNVNIKKLTDNAPEAQDLFWYAMKQAEKDVAFVADGAQLLVEAVPSATADGFVMTISKLVDETEINEALVRGTRTRVRPAEIRVKKKNKMVLPVYIYQFDDFEDLCMAMQRVNGAFYGRSSLYKYREQFYLYLMPFDNFLFFEVENILLDFARRVNDAARFLGYLNEYAQTMIADGAVEIVRQYFCS